MKSKVRQSSHLPERGGLVIREVHRSTLGQFISSDVQSAAENQIKRLTFDVSISQVGICGCNNIYNFLHQILHIVPVLYLTFPLWR